jgi:hypothetical protein
MDIFTELLCSIRTPMATLASGLFPTLLPATVNHDIFTALNYFMISHKYVDFLHV